MNEFLRDLKTIYQLAKPRSSSDKTNAMEEFYKEQAKDYDSFRSRLLPARMDLFKVIEKWKPGPVWVDFGAGTGVNLEYINLNLFKKIHLVDLSESLLDVARKRSQNFSEHQIHLHHQDILDFEPPEKVDLVTFSYSLTMIPNWLGALDRALEILKPGGLIAVVDFHIPQKGTNNSLSFFLENHFWPAWFSWDGVYLSRDHVHYLKNNFSELFFEQDVHQLPYLPYSKVPYYLFIGQKTVL